MIEYIIPALVVVLPSAGFVGGAIWATRGRSDYIDQLRIKLALKDRRIATLGVLNAILHQELDVHVKRKLAADAQRREAGKLGNAAQAAKKISKDTQAKLIQQATHDGMRANLRTAEPV